MHTNNYMLILILLKTLYVVFDLYQEEKTIHLVNNDFNNISVKSFVFLWVNEVNENHVCILSSIQSE